MEGTTMLNLIPILLAKAGATAITTKVVVAGAVSVATLGTAGATGVLPVEDLLPGGPSVAVSDERSGEDVLKELEVVPEQAGRAGEALDKAAEVAAEEAQEALQAAKEAAASAAEDARLAAEEAQRAASEKAERPDAAAGGAPQQTEQAEQTERRERHSSSDAVVNQPEVDAGNGAGSGRP